MFDEDSHNLSSRDEPDVFGDKQMDFDSFELRTISIDPLRLALPTFKYLDKGAIY